MYTHSWNPPILLKRELGGGRAGEDLRKIESPGGGVRGVDTFLLLLMFNCIYCV